MTVRHLIVDDMKLRHEGIRAILEGHECDSAMNVTQAVLFLRERLIFAEPPEPYTAIFLDHDIESGDDRRDVIHLVHWILDNAFVCDTLRQAGTRFLIHSWNPVGAENMASLLRQGGFPVRVKPFEGGPR